MVFRKNLRSLERRWEKISKFLGDLPSEQIFYRNIPLGAPDTYTVHSSLSTSSRPEIEIKRKTLLPGGLESPTFALLQHHHASTAYKYDALTDCATGAG